MRIDAHQHYWVFDPVRDAWIDDSMKMLRRDFLPSDAAPLLSAGGFGGVVAVQADQSERETEFLLGLAERAPYIKGVVGWVDLLAPDLDERLAQWNDRKTLKGFRHIAQAEANDFLARADVATGVRRIGAHGYAFDVLVTPPQMAAATTLVAQCPDVRFILDHCAKPRIREREISEWRSALTQLGAHTHVACKLSGLVTEASWGRWTDADLEPYLDAALDAFGPERILFGSDWPVCLVAAEWSRVTGTIERWSSRLSDTERAALFGGTATSVYRLEDDGSRPR